MRIFDQDIQPGEHKVIHLPVPKLYNFTPVYLPVHVICGTKPGPTLCITAAIHGDEVNGIEIIHRLLKASRPGGHALAGTVIAIPVVNIYGFLFQDRYLPDRRDLNRSFPGSEKGSLASRFARVLTQTLFSKATHIIDLHTGSLKRTNYPQIRIDVDDPNLLALAQAFGAPVIVPAPQRAGSFREYAKQHKLPYLLYEAGEASRFDEDCIHKGVAGIIGVMQHLKMLPHINMMEHLKNLPAIISAFMERKTSMVSNASYWVRSQYGGIFLAKKSLGDYVEKGDVLAAIIHPAGAEDYEIISPIAGMIIGRSDSPLIHEGAGIFHIACFEKNDIASIKTEWLQELKDTDKEEDKSLETHFDG